MGDRCPKVDLKVEPVFGPHPEIGDEQSIESQRKFSGRGGGGGRLPQKRQGRAAPVIDVKQNGAHAALFQKPGKSHGAARPFVKDRAGHPLHRADIMAVEIRVRHRPVQPADTIALRQKHMAGGLIIAKMGGDEKHGAASGAGLGQG